MMIQTIVLISFLITVGIIFVVETNKFYRKEKMKGNIDKDEEDKDIMMW